jgi:hypothetical protein
MTWAALTRSSSRKQIPNLLSKNIFIGRTDIVARIEQLLLDQQRPPLLLYGQRRMGKTSLLHNLNNPSYQWGLLLPGRVNSPLVQSMRELVLWAADALQLLESMRSNDNWQTDGLPILRQPVRFVIADTRKKNCQPTYLC